MGRSWRFVATALAFAAFGAAAVLVNVLYFLPLRVLVPAGATRQRWARAGIRVSFKVFLQLVELLGVIKLDLDREALARLGGTRAVIVANHPTLLDVTVLLAYVKHASCVVKPSLWRNPFLSGALRAAVLRSEQRPGAAAARLRRSARTRRVADRVSRSDALGSRRAAAAPARRSDDRTELRCGAQDRALALRARAAHEG